MRKYYSFIGLIALLLVTVACGSSETANTGSVESSGNATDLLGRVRLGATVSDNGYSMVVNEIVDPVTPLASFNQTSGERTISVYVTFKNDSNETPFLITARSASLLASNSFIYGSLPMISDDELATVELMQGEEVNGWVGFEIPNDEKPLVFTYLTQIVELESRLTK